MNVIFSSVLSTKIVKKYFTSSMIFENKYVEKKKNLKIMVIKLGLNKVKRLI